MLVAGGDERRRWKDKWRENIIEEDAKEETGEKPDYYLIAGGIA